MSCDTTSSTTRNLMRNFRRWKGICLLDGARAVSWRIWAENAPFDLKDILKARGYRWNGDSDPQPRAWYIDVPEAQREAELRFLRTEIYRYEVDPPVRRIDAYDRFSDRI